MIAGNERPLSEFWSEDRRRLEAREFDRILAYHRMIYASPQPNHRGAAVSPRQGISIVSSASDNLIRSAKMNAGAAT